MRAPSVWCWRAPIRKFLGYPAMRTPRRHEPDEGIWEVRGGRQHFVYSKVMAWVAFDRAAHSLTAQINAELGQRWREIADEIQLLRVSVPAPHLLPW